jgi:hypothetical protein
MQVLFYGGVFNFPKGFVYGASDGYTFVNDSGMVLTIFGSATYDFCAFMLNFDASGACKIGDMTDYRIYDDADCGAWVEFIPTLNGVNCAGIVPPAQLTWMLTIGDVVEGPCELQISGTVGPSVAGCVIELTTPCPGDPATAYGNCEAWFGDSIDGNWSFDYTFTVDVTGEAALSLVCEEYEYKFYEVDLTGVTITVNCFESGNPIGSFTIDPALLVYYNNYCGCQPAYPDPCDDVAYVALQSLWDDVPLEWNVSCDDYRCYANKCASFWVDSDYSSLSFTNLTGFVAFKLDVVPDNYGCPHGNAATCYNKFCPIDIPVGIPM